MDKNCRRSNQKPLKFSFPKNKNTKKIGRDRIKTSKILVKGQKKATVFFLFDQNQVKILKKDDHFRFGAKPQNSRLPKSTHS